MNFINRYKSLNSKLFDNSIAFFSTFFIQFAIQIIYPPLMIMIWGANNFGIILFFIAVPTSLSFLIINFTTPARQDMAKAHLKKDYDGVNKIYTNTVILLSISYLVYFLASLFFLKFSGFEQLQGSIAKDKINLILSLIFASVLVGFFSNIFSLKISYLGVYHISRYLDLVFDLFIKISMLIIGFYSKSFLNLFIIYLILNCIKTISFYFFSSKIKNIFCLIKKVDIKYIRNIFNKSFPYYFIQINEIIKTSFIILIIGIYFDFKTVAFVSTIRTMFYFFPRKFFDIISELLQFEYIKLFTSRELEKLKKLYLRQNLLIVSLSIIYLIICYLIGLKIYDLWTNNEFTYEVKLFYFLIFDCFFFLISNSIISFLKSINKFFSISIYTLISQVILITSMYIAFLNGKDYEIFFIISFILSFVVFCISIIYFKKSLDFMRSK